MVHKHLFALEKLTVSRSALLNESKFVFREDKAAAARSQALKPI